MREVIARAAIGFAILAGAPASAQPSAQPAAPEVTRAELWMKSARRAARSGDCATVVMLGHRVSAIAADYHARVFVVEPAIARCLSPPPPPPPPDLRHGAFGTKVGLGFGAPYGGQLGFGAELGLPHVGLVVGMGFAGSLSGSVGVRAYLRGRRATVRPHASVVYGATAVHVERVWSGTSWQEVRHPMYGLGLYAGVDIDIGDPGAFRLGIGGGVSRQSDVPMEVDRSRYAPSLVVGVDHEW